MESSSQSQMPPRPNQGPRVDRQVKRKDHLLKRRHPVVRELQEKEEFLHRSFGNLYTAFSSSSLDCVLSFDVSRDELRDREGMRIEGTGHE